MRCGLLDELGRHTAYHTLRYTTLQYSTVLYSTVGWVGLGSNVMHSSPAYALL